MRAMPPTMRTVVADKGSAMIKGGIDLSPANNVLKTQNNGGEIKFHMDPAILLGRPKSLVVMDHKYSTDDRPF